MTLTIPPNILRNANLSDDSIAATVEKLNTEAERLRAEIEDLERRIAVDLALSCLGVKRLFTGATSMLEVNAHERIAPKGSLFLGAGMASALERLDDSRLRARVNAFSADGLRLLQSSRKELGDA